VKDEQQRRLISKQDRLEAIARRIIVDAATPGQLQRADVRVSPMLIAALRKALK
jgi:hypothetical protein